MVCMCKGLVPRGPSLLYVRVLCCAVASLPCCRSAHCCCAAQVESSHIDTAMERLSKVQRAVLSLAGAMGSMGSGGGTVADLRGEGRWALEWCSSSCWECCGCRGVLLLGLGRMGGASGARSTVTVLIKGGGKG